MQALSASFDLDTEILAIRALCNRDSEYASATPKQLRALNILINSVLREADDRIPVLRLLTGIQRLTSTKQLTLKTVSTLIDVIKEVEPDNWEASAYGETLLLALEDRIESRSVQRQRRAIPLRDPYDLSHL